MRQLEINSHVNFRGRLLQSIEASGFAKGAVAARAGVHPSALSRWLKSATPDFASASKIAQCLNVEVNWLLTGEGPMRKLEPARDSGTPKADTARWSSVAPATTTQEDRYKLAAPAPHRGPPRSDVDETLRLRHKLMLDRVAEDTLAMVTASPSRREELAEMAKMHVDHFRKWCDSTLRLD
jgi:transcriptional regulator with XRE-family HTH domain